MEQDEPGIVDTLSTHDCWTLLASATVGRLALVVNGRPEIFPVNHVVDHGSVVFRTSPGTKLAAIGDATPVAFEVDGLDVEAGIAWSVILKGRAARVSGPRSKLPPRASRSDSSANRFWAKRTP